jgi:hypothetical protein
MKSRFDKKSSNIYWLKQAGMIESCVQVDRMTRANCYQFCNRRNSLSLEERQAHYDHLLAKIQKNGFSEEHPIIAMLNRTDDEKDKIIDGHHRLSITLDINAPFVPVRFAYS